MRLGSIYSEIQAQFAGEETIEVSIWGITYS